MSSVEALWRVQFDTENGQEWELGWGIAVIETGRLFGGDSGYTYVGSCEVAADVVRGSLRITRHDPNIHSVFGDLNEFDINYEGRRVADNRIIGNLFGGEGAPPVTFCMERVAELP